LLYLGLRLLLLELLIRNGLFLLFFQLLLLQELLEPGFWLRIFRAATGPSGKIIFVGPRF
jgi:hypothetical protein